MFASMIPSIESVFPSNNLCVCVRVCLTRVPSYWNMLYTHLMLTNALFLCNHSDCHLSLFHQMCGRVEASCRPNQNTSPDIMVDMALNMKMNPCASDLIERTQSKCGCAGPHDMANVQSSVNRLACECCERRRAGLPSSRWYARDLLTQSKFPYWISYAAERAEALLNWMLEREWPWKCGCGSLRDGNPSARHALRKHRKNSFSCHDLVLNGASLICDTISMAECAMLGIVHNWPNMNWTLTNLSLIW